MKNFGTVPRRALDAKTISPNKRLGNKNARKITREFLSQVTFFVSIIVNPASPSLPCRGERLASAKKICAAMLLKLLHPSGLLTSLRTKRTLNTILRFDAFSEEEPSRGSERSWRSRMSITKKLRSRQFLKPLAVVIRLPKDGLQLAPETTHPAFIIAPAIATIRPP